MIRHFAAGASLCLLLLHVSVAAAQSLEDLDLDAVDAAIRQGHLSVSGPMAPAPGSTWIRSMVELLGRRPGVGYFPAPGSAACWEGGQDHGTYRMDLSARPWGPSGSGPLSEEDLVRRYYGGMPRLGGSWPCGMAGELFAINGVVLEAAYSGQCPVVPIDPTDRDGSPSLQEQTDLAVTHPRCSETYRSCWWDPKSGGSPSSAIVATTAQARSWGWCEPGIAVRQSILCGWPIYYLVTEELAAGADWCEAEPDQDPVPDPPSDAPECPDCVIPECSTACRDLADRVEIALGGPRRTILPDGSGAPDPSGRWQWVPAWLRPALERLAGECGALERCWVPSIESTGRLSTEVIDAGVTP